MKFVPVNIDNTFGAIGFVSRIVPWIYPISIIKADPLTGEPIRDSKGLCQICGPGMHERVKYSLRVNQLI